MSWLTSCATQKRVGGDSYLKTQFTYFACTAFKYQTELDPHAETHMQKQAPPNSEILQQNLCA